MIDITLAELVSLSVSERETTVAGSLQPLYPSRFPPGQSNFRIHTLAQKIELLQGLNKTTGKETGLYVEIISLWFHHKEGKDSPSAILSVLKIYGYDSMADKIYLQTFDFNELKRIKEQLFLRFEMRSPLIPLIALNDWLESLELKDGK